MNKGMISYNCDVTINMPAHWATVIPDYAALKLDSCCGEV